MKLDERVQVYVGWTGMASSSSLARFKGASTSSDPLETVEIDPQYANGLGLRTGDIVSFLMSFLLIVVLELLIEYVGYRKVEIGLLQDPPMASSVVTEPFSSDDWEIIVSCQFLLLMKAH